MKRLAGILALLPRLPTVLRTVRFVRPAQAFAQLRHMLLGSPAPVRIEGPAPTLAIESPDTPFLPPPAHVRGDAREIELLRFRFSLGEPGAPGPSGASVDWDSDQHGPLFAYHLHQHEYLRLASFSPEQRAACLLDWIEHHPRGIGWDPHPISLRLVCWGRLLLTPGALPVEAGLRDALVRSMADQAETLARGLEVRLQANHLLSNLLGVVFSGMLCDGAPAARWRGLADALIEELDAQVLPDGGHEERSPMYHALLLENVLDLLNLCRSAPERAPAGLEAALASTASRMLQALDVLTHPDGRLALFADSAFDVAAEPERLRDYATRLGLAPEVARPGESRLLPQAGYLRLAAGPFDLIASVSGPAPAHQPGHAHCDALSFELSVGGRRLISDTGLFEYRPGPHRDRARSTASHATLMIDGQEQAEVWAAHRIGGRPEVALTAWDEAGLAEARCRAWPRGAPVHHRRFSVDATGVEIVDRVEGPAQEIVSRWPIAPGWEVELEAGAAWARSESIVRFELPAGFDWRLERAAYYPSFGVEIERPVLVGRCVDAAAAERGARMRITRVDAEAPSVLADESAQSDQTD